MNRGEDTIRDQKKRISPVVRFRLAVCAAAAVCACLIKMYGGSIYERVKEVYIDYSRQTIVSQRDIDNSEFMQAVRK